MGHLLHVLGAPSRSPISEPIGRVSDGTSAALVTDASVVYVGLRVEVGDVGGSLVVAATVVGAAPWVECAHESPPRVAMSSVGVSAATSASISLRRSVSALCHSARSLGMARTLGRQKIASGWLLA